ncbi:hypothetical protein UCD39_03320 [Nitrospirillum sp. BR 11752]|uniref:hypothetical protein n=1 Tax=Nitrospirillum sp. BR 11752 TaxID=3104293 RepID=UPI002EA0AF6C|nr:hypothetical protein [Nitrospirillum sp. BR 11752]
MIKERQTGCRLRQQIRVRENIDLFPVSYQESPGFRPEFGIGLRKGQLPAGSGEGQGMPGRTKGTSIIAPRVFVPEKFMSEFEVGGRYIVFGTWKANQNAWTSKDGKSSILFRNLKMIAYQKAQFCRIDLPVEGEDEEV